MNLSTRQKIGAIVGAIILGVLVVVSYALITIDSKRLVQVASHQIQVSSGRALQIKGPVSIQFFPQLAIVAEQVSLSNPAWAADPDMLTIKQVAFSLAWLPLFEKRIEIRNVSVDDMQLVLQAAPAEIKTAGNWEVDLADTSSSSTDAAKDFGFEFAEVHLNQVSVRYKDRSGALVDTLLIKRLDIKDDDGQTRLDGMLSWHGVPLTVKGQTDSWERFANQQPATASDFALDFNLGFNKQSARLRGKILIDPQRSPTLDLNIHSEALDLRSFVKTNAAAAVSTQSKSGFFSNAAMGLDQLPVWQGQLQASISALTLPNGILLQQLKTTIVAASDDSVNLSPLSFQIGSGQVVADAKMTGVHSRVPAIQLRGHATGFTLGQVMAQMGKGGQLSRGPAQAAFHINAQGKSPHDLAATANGELQLSVGAATVSSSLVDAGGDFLMTVMNTINPLRKTSDVTQLQCAVAYLPVQKGLVVINQSIGVQTDRLDVTLGGQVNLGSETLNLNITPKEKSGLTTGVNPAGLVQITGSLSNPRMGINKTGVVKQATGVGLAIMTGGISLLAQNAVGVVSKSSPCDNVLRPWSKVAGGLATMH